MGRVHCHIAETRRQLDEALRIRYRVFAEDLEYIDSACGRVPREIDPFDTLDTTLHFVVFVDDMPVGTGRMMLPNPEVARTCGRSFGFDIESKFDLTALSHPKMHLAETMRYCVLRSARMTKVAAALHAAGVLKSLDMGITHWVGCANMETDSPEDALRIQSIGATRGFAHENIWIPSHGATRPPTEIRRPFFHASERSLAGTNESTTRFPRLLEMYAQRMGARIIGPPIYETRFRMYSIPILITVAEQHVISAHGRHPQHTGDMPSIAA